MKNKIIKYSNIFIICLFSFVLIELSCYPLEDVFSKTLPVYFLNIIYILFFVFILYLITNKLKLSLYIVTTFLFLFSIINYFVTLYHGTLFTVSELLNIKTALNVIGRYSINFDYRFVLIIIIYLIIILIIKKTSSFDNNKRNIKSVFFLLFFIVVGYYGFFSDKPIKPKSTIGFSIHDSSKQYGYLLAFQENAIKFSNPYNKPNNYENNIELIKKEFEEYSNKKSSTNIDEYPDIICILNETYYDPSIYLDINVDNDPFEYAKNIDNSIFGYCMNSGGGTNCTEYELLTSNLTYLLNGSAPFTFLNLKKSNNIVSYLKNFNYETFAMHFLSGENYNRINGYKDLGFDNIFFFDDIIDRYNYSHYGNRYHTDEEDYEHLIDIYCNYETSNPKFMYLLTYQNHGGYEINDESFDTVHCSNQLGDYTDDMNEFLTSIKMSDTALKKLIDYYKESDRKVIVVMTGDHCPSFMSQIDGINSKKQNTLNRNLCPYIIWSNYLDLSNKSNNQMNDICLFPKVLESAGINLSFYYDSILKLQSVLPNILNNEILKDFKGDIYNLSDNKEYEELLNKYYCLEYMNLSNNNLDMFAPAKGVR